MALLNSIMTERQNRRKIKNSLELVEPCFKLVSDCSKIVHLLNSLSNRLKDIQVMQDSRVYSNRSEDTNYLKISQNRSNKKNNRK